MLYASFSLLEIGFRMLFSCFSFGFRVLFSFAFRFLLVLWLDRTFLYHKGIGSENILLFVGLVFGVKNVIGRIVSLVSST